MMRIPTRQEAYRIFRRIAGQETESVGPVQMKATGSTGVAKGIIPAAHVSGNPKIQRAHETSTTLGTKTYKVHQPISNRNGALVASDPIAYWHDQDGNKGIQGKLVDVSAIVVDSDYLMGLRPVAPGNTLLLTAATERNTTSASFITVKRFFVTRPGRYRLKLKLSRDGGQAQARVGVEFPDGSIVAASASATYSGTVHPTYSAEQSVDMTMTVGWGMFIVLQLLNTSGPTQTAYCQDVTVTYADATASLASHDSVLTN